MPEQHSITPPMTHIDPDLPRRKGHGLVGFGLRVLLRSLAGGALAACAIGFIWFADNVTSQPLTHPPRAEAIVALTGGPDRIAEAMSLLASGHGERLLITGVNPGTTFPEIIELNPKYRHLFECCVDLGYEAINTVGNAQEAEHWVRAHRIQQSLIVVTSAYHMPRALAEMRHRLPGVALHPVAVMPDRLRTSTWWQDIRAVQLMGREYVKFLVAKARMLLIDPDPAPQDAALQAART